MNYPLTQRTGALAEMIVAQLFVSWSWNVGRDQIDIGYDLFVAPAHDTYKGGRFLVQIKGTAKATAGGLFGPLYLRADSVSTQRPSFQSL